LKKSVRKRRVLRKKVSKSGKIEKKVQKRRKKSTGFLNSGIGVKIGGQGQSSRKLSSRK
jgi:hypothetical protein